MRPLAALVWCPVLLAVSRSAECTQTPRLDPGARIRFDAQSFGSQLTGTLARWESDKLMVQVDGDAPGLLLIVPADSVTRIDVRYKRRMTTEGAVIGVLGGMVLAAVASPDWVDENGDCTTLPCLAHKVSPNLDTRMAALGATGLLLGAIVGSQHKSATWVTVPLQQLNVGATPDGGLALGFRISFD